MHIARKFDYRCAYCDAKPDRIDTEHVTPLSGGRLNVLGNLLPTCNPCNADKRDLTPSEWAIDRERRGLPPRTTSGASEDPRYWHLTATEPIRAAVPA